MGRYSRGVFSLSAPEQKRRSAFLIMGTLEWTDSWNNGWPQMVLGITRTLLKLEPSILVIPSLYSTLLAHSLFLRVWILDCCCLGSFFVKCACFICLGWWAILFYLYSLLTDRRISKWHMIEYLIKKLIRSRNRRNRKSCFLGMTCTTCWLYPVRKI